MGLCRGANGFACLERRVGPPLKLASFRINSAAPGRKSASAWQTAKPSSAHPRHGARLASKTAKSVKIAAKAEPSASRILLTPGSLETPLQPPGSAAAASSNMAPADIAEQHPTVGVASSNTRTIEAQVSAARTLAERLTIAATAAAPEMKANKADKSGRPVTSGRGNGDTDLLVAVVMARPDIKSVSELTGKTIAIDDRYSGSNGSVRTAIVAAGAPEVQLSEGQTTAINRVVSGEVPAAVLALVSADAAEGFPEIAGFRIFHIPLSPRSLKAQP